MTRRQKRRQWDARSHFFWAVWWVVAAVTCAFVAWFQAVQP